MNSADELERRLRDALSNSRYPRSGSYAPEWILDKFMGPHPLWLAEGLTQAMPLEPGSRILDLGCGMGATSVFFAREFGCKVWAVDLWTDASSIYSTVRQSGVEKLVFPIQCDARDLPFAASYFDAVVSVDAYQYFGTDVMYLKYLLEFLRDGGQLGIVSPALRLELDDELPQFLRQRWVPDMCSYKSASWWASHWRRTGLVEVCQADYLSCGRDDWLQWLLACDIVDRGYEPDAEMLRRDSDELLGFCRVIARKKMSNG